MELLKFSKFKLQLQALITEVGDLRGRERSATEQVNLLIQKQKQTEDESGRKLRELQAELDSSNDLCQKLERQVSYLQNDNRLLENKQKELQGTIQNLLQSREAFINIYQESTCEMKRSIQIRDRRLAFLSEKLKAQLQVFDSIEKEAFSIEQIVDSVHCLVSEKEKVGMSCPYKKKKKNLCQLVFGLFSISNFSIYITFLNASCDFLVSELRGKMDKVSAIEELLIAKLLELESRLKSDGDELQRKNVIISELEAELEAAKSGSIFQPQLEELQKSLLAKEIVIENLLSEKKALHFEVGHLGMILQKIQKTVLHMNREDKRTFSLLLEVQQASLNPQQEHTSACNTFWKNRDSCVSELVPFEPKSVANVLCIPADEAKLFGSSQESAHAESQLLDNALNIREDEAKHCKRLVHQLESEGSTTQAERVEDPG